MFSTLNTETNTEPEGDLMEKLYKDPLGKDLKNLAISEIKKHDREYGKNRTTIKFTHDGTKYRVTLTLENLEIDAPENGEYPFTEV